MNIKNNKIVISNFLNHAEFELIKSTWLGYNVHWTYNDGVIHENKDDDFQFVNVVWESIRGASSPYTWDSILPIMSFINPAALIRIKANLRTKTSTINRSEWHRDILIPGSLTAIFYINNSDGYTEFKDGDIFNSVENTLLIFPSHMEHLGTTCTNTNRRVLINFNFIPEHNSKLVGLLYTHADKEYLDNWTVR